MIGKIKILFVALLIFCQNMNAQKLNAQREKDSLLSELQLDIGDILYRYNPTYTDIGTLYFVLCSIEKNKISNTFILSKKYDRFDTIVVENNYSKILESSLVRLKKENSFLVVAPYLFIEEDSNGNRSVHYRQKVIEDLSEGLYEITRISSSNIILPMSIAVKRFFNVF